MWTCGDEQPPCPLVGVDVRHHHRLWLGYLAAYPGLGTFSRQAGWTQKGEYEAEVAKAKELEPCTPALHQHAPEAIAVDPRPWPSASACS